jgi:hypothetical protein
MVTTLKADATHASLIAAVRWSVRQLRIFWMDHPHLIVVNLEKHG